MLLFADEFVEHFFELNGPLADWKLLNVYCVLILGILVHQTSGSDTALCFDNLSLEPFVPWQDFCEWLSIYSSLYLLGKLSRIMVWNLGCPSSSHTFRSVHQYHRDDRCVKLGFYDLPIVIQIL